MRDHSWEAARTDAHRLGALRTARTESIDLHHAAGRILATELRANYPLPHCETSAMDGYAVNGPGPWQLLADLAPNPGEGKTPGIAEGQAIAVVTGSLIPTGTTSILRVEDSHRDGALLVADRPPRTGADIRPAGTEAAAGELLASAGTRLRAGVLATAAVSGHDELSVFARPSVHLVFTGDEVVTSGYPAPGQVRDGFSPVLPLLVATLGGQTSGTTRIGDTLEATVAALDSASARDANIIVTTGGTGFSDRDFVRAAVHELGGSEVISSIAMRPGHPSMLSSLPGNRLLVALPGNPLAALMAAATLVDPILRGATGRAPARLRAAVSTADFGPLPGRTRLVPASWTRDAAGPDALAPSEHIAPAMLRGLAAADAVLVIGPEGAAAGAPVHYLELPW